MREKLNKCPKGKSFPPKAEKISFVGKISWIYFRSQRVDRASKKKNVVVEYHHLSFWNLFLTLKFETFE